MPRVVITFRGRVQGVGFRQKTVEISKRFDVTGTVQNLPGGDVELVAEGKSAEIDGFIAAIESRMSRHIDKVTRRSEPGCEPFDDFSILR